ncbi:MAG: hypothetical protein H6624_03950 [Bdellovibrionaceae bacterium]|nr:hypothetical protein [Bdellovibrionales bacterium]MCB9083467.1 hypothetical protein [Pseudobdellovibrionaceae bacterium]
MQKRNIIFAVLMFTVMGVAGVMLLNRPGTEEDGPRLSETNQVASPGRENKRQETESVGTSDSADQLVRGGHQVAGKDPGEASAAAGSSILSKSSQEAIGAGSLRGHVWSPEDLAEILLNSESPLAGTLKDFFAVKRKHLRTPEEDAALKAQLSDANQIQSLAEFLKSKDRAAYTAADEALRLTAVSFINEAVRFEENPSRMDAVEAAKTVVLADNIRPEFSRDLKVSLAGDKVELAMQLILYFPETRNQLVASSTGTNQEIVRRAADYVGE